MKCISVLSKYFPIVTYVSYVMFLFNPAATLLNLSPTVGPKYPNDESTTYDHNDGSLCRRCELMRTVTLSESSICTDPNDGPTKCMIISTHSIGAMPSVLFFIYV